MSIGLLPRDAKGTFGREGDIRNRFGKLNDPGKSALRRLCIMPQQLRTSPLFVIDSFPGVGGLDPRGGIFHRRRLRR